MDIEIKFMKILVTGANGYIGYHVIKALLDEGHEVIAADFNNNRIDKRAKFINLDIYGEHENLYEKLGKPEVLLHLACKDVPVHNSLWHIESIPKNFKFIKELVDNGLKQVVTVGSMHDIGYYEGAVPEDAVPNPMSFYGISKDTLRRLLTVFLKDKDVSYKHLRFFYTYGDDEQSSGSVFSKILQLAKEGKEFFPFTDGKNKFDYIEIHELAKQITAVIEQNEIDGIINCCSGKPITIREQVEKYIGEHNLKIKPDFGKYPSRPYDSPCIYGDNTKIKKIMELKALQKK